MLQERNCPRPPPTELTRRISYYASACPSGAFLGQAPSLRKQWIASYSLRKFQQLLKFSVAGH